MKVAVCVKQVPDAAVHKRLDATTHRLDRSGEGALNATDVNAVEEALRLKEAHGGEVVVVSLGPEKAMESLRKALAMGADRAVLVSDAAAAGSDLLATGYALAKALEREEADLVLFGQQSSDADGAVLWAAVSDRLRRPMVSQVAELTLEGGTISGKRQTEFGYDVISAPLPAVVAVSDAINEPRYPSLKGIMGAKSKPQEVLALADARHRGRSGRRDGLAHRRAIDLAATAEERSGEDRGRRRRRREDRRVPRREEAHLMAGTLVFLETHDGEPTKGGLGVLGKAASLGGDVSGVVLGSGVRDAAARAGAFGASTVYVVDDEALASPLPQPRVDALETVVRESGADTILFAASVLAADVASGLAARLEAGLNWDLTDLRLEGGELVGTRPALGDTVLVEVGWTSTPRLALIRSGTFDPVESGGTAEVKDVAASFQDFSTAATLVDHLQEASSGPSIEDADVIVAGGRGLGGPEGFSVCEDLAAALGGAVAATRAVVDAGWYPYAAQVGQTGKTVSPKLYIALGISGAIQHKVGMQGSGTIVAVNKDANAPIFDFADLGVVGDLSQIAPKLTELLKART